MQEKKAKVSRVIVDTDVGTDDAAAILMLLTHRDLIQVEAITTVHGNVSVTQATTNIKKLLQLAHKFQLITEETQPLVYAGAAEALIQKKLPTWEGHGTDGLGDANLDDLITSDFAVKIEGVPAAMGLIQLVRKHPHELSILMIGPATNIALACKLDVEFPSLVKELILMGGTHQGRGNVTATSEFNIYADAEAAHIVLSKFGDNKISIISWELTITCGFSWEWIDKLKLEKENHFFVRILKKYEELCRTVNENSKKKLSLVLCDCLAAAVLLAREQIVVENENVGVTVETAGKETYGTLVIDWHGNHKYNLVNIITAVSLEKFTQLIHETIDRIHLSKNL